MVLEEFGALDDVSHLAAASNSEEGIHVTVTG